MMRLQAETVQMLNCLASMGYLIEIIDRQGYYIYCSENCNYDAYTPQEMIGKHITEAYNLTEETSILFHTLRTGIPTRNMLMQYKSRKTNRELHWLYDSFPVLDKGTIAGAITLYRPLNELQCILKSLNINSLCKCPESSQLGTKRKKMYTFNDIVHSNEKMQKVISIAKKVATNQTPILLVGDTGTGKELFAQSIHSWSKNDQSPFVAVNCAAIPDNLLESILFGVAKGAYTGAIEKQGLFEESNGGTIFLDEIHTLSLEMQAKLLRVLENNKVRRVGGDHEISIDTRIISAVNINPMELVRKNQLKLDLFYRIAVITLDIPPLKDRGFDIELLSNIFIREASSRLGKDIQLIDREVFLLFSKYNWPGNVRELRHTLEYAANIMDDQETILTKAHLPEYFHLTNHTVTRSPSIPLLDITVADYSLGDYKIARQQAINEFTDRFNRTFLTKALNENNGNISKTARSIHISRQHLHELVSKYDL